MDEGLVPCVMNPNGSKMSLVHRGGGSTRLPTDAHSYASLARWASPSDVSRAFGAAMVAVEGAAGRPLARSAVKTAAAHSLAAWRCTRLSFSDATSRRRAQPAALAEAASPRLKGAAVCSWRESPTEAEEDDEADVEAEAAPTPAPAVSAERENADASPRPRLDAATSPWPPPRPPAAALVAVGAKTPEALAAAAALLVEAAKLSAVFFSLATTASATWAAGAAAR